MSLLLWHDSGGVSDLDSTTTTNALQSTRFKSSILLTIDDMAHLQGHIAFVVVMAQKPEKFLLCGRAKCCLFRHSGWTDG